MSGSWTEERIEEAIDRWNDGESASQISRALGYVSRNAVIGKITRLFNAGDTRVKRPCGRRQVGTVPVAEKQRNADQRSLFILQRHEHDGATFKEIASDLGSSEGAVNVEYYRIIRELNASEAA